MDRLTRFVAAWAFGASEDEAAPQVVAQTRQRTSGQRGGPWVSEGRKVYRGEVSDECIATRSDLVNRADLPTPGVGLTQVVKHRRKGRVVRIEVRQVLDEPIECSYAVHKECLKGVLRDRLNCLTRKAMPLLSTRADVGCRYSLAFV